jgi:hypothetical protein
MVVKTSDLLMPSIRRAQIFHRRERVRMLLAQQTTPSCQRLLLKLLRFRQIALPR